MKVPVKKHTSHKLNFAENVEAPFGLALSSRLGRFEQVVHVGTSEIILGMT